MLLPDLDPNALIDTDLFISHASADDSVVSLIDAALNAAGITTWVDHEHGISYGDRWQDAIDDATIHCRAALYILSGSSRRSEWCKRELTRIQEQLKRPVYVLKLTPTPDWQLPIPVDTIQDIDFSGAPITAQIDPRFVSSLANPPQDIVKALETLNVESLEKAFAEMIGQRLAQMTVLEGNKPLATLRQLAVTHGGFDREAAEALLAAEVTADSMLGVLSTLVAWNFIEFDDRRYTLDPLVANAVGADEVAHSIHYDHFLMRAKRQHERQDYAALEPDAANLDAAFAWAISQQRAEQSVELARYGGYFLLNRGRIRQEFDWARQASDLTDEYHDSVLWAQAQNNLGIAFHDLSMVEKRAANLRRAIAAYQAALTYYTPQVAPLDYAATQNNLGITYTDLSQVEERTNNLRHAIDAFQDVLTYRTPQATPLDYAQTQNNLGTAYVNLSQVEERIANLRRAFTAYQAALTYRTPQATPLDYATTQNNLGNTYSDLSKVEDQADNLRRAITAYQAALAYRTPQAAPLDYAATQNNLGTAYINLSQVEERIDNLHRAIDAFRYALIYYNPQTAPFNYATMQSNLGAAYSDLALVEDRVYNLRRAIAAYQAALTYSTPQTAPLDYAQTQNNLGAAYSDLVLVEDGAYNLRRAIDVFQDALTYVNPQVAPLDYAQMQNNLGAVYWNLSHVEDRADNLRRAVNALQTALIYRTPQVAPLDYAQTQSNLGLALWDIDDNSVACAAWQESERYFRQMGNTDIADRLVRHMRANGC